MQPSDIVVLTPPGAADPAIAIAAARAGSRGVFDLEFPADPGRTTDSLAKLSA